MDLRRRIQSQVERDVAREYPDTEELDMAKFDYDKLREIHDQYRTKRNEASQSGDFSILADFWGAGDDIIYRWSGGRGKKEFIAKGRKELLKYVLGSETAGHKGYTYPNFRDWPRVIDPEQGVIVEFWDTVSPFKREDGSSIHVEGHGGTWIRYNDDYRIVMANDFFDQEANDAFFRELMDRDLLDPLFKEHLMEVWAREAETDFRNTSEEIAKKATAGTARKE
jgi:hypothetical protein